MIMLPITQTLTIAIKPRPVPIAAPDLSASEVA